MKNSVAISIIDLDEHELSTISEKVYELSARGEMHITEQFVALSCRLRRSEKGYASDWHLAGEPTLIVVQQGVLRIYLRDGSYNDFSAGDYFVAQDRLPQGTLFNSDKHGHRAEVVGEEALLATHIKLAQPLQ